MNRISAKLTDRLGRIRANTVGVSAEDVRKLKLTPTLVEDIFECLESSEMIDKQMALFFSETLIEPGKLTVAQEDKLISLVKDLSQAKIKQVRPACYNFLRKFHIKVPEYRQLMLKGLIDPDPIVRKEALLGYPTYGRPNEVLPLEPFETDSYFAEISMNGPLIFELRNLALETIERTIGKKFTKAEKADTTPDGEVVFWWDWTPYHRWKKHWLNRIFRRTDRE
ncbi:MAG TPA: hypothetical protein VD994_21390 [Prosthecobacter sp.]|nr:hypothetical protein [Prosthecobacter sp.]